MILSAFGRSIYRFCWVLSFSAVLIMLCTSGSPPEFVHAFQANERRHPMLLDGRTREDELG